MGAIGLPPVVVERQPPTARVDVEGSFGDPSGEERRCGVVGRSLSGSWLHSSEAPAAVPTRMTGRIRRRPGWPRRSATTRSRSARSTSPRASCWPRSTARPSKPRASRSCGPSSSGPGSSCSRRSPAVWSSSSRSTPARAAVLEPRRPTPAPTTSSGTNDALAELLAERRIAALAPRRRRTPTPSSSTRDTAEREDLRTLSDLAAVAARLTFGGPPECATRRSASTASTGLRVDVRRGRCPRRRRPAHPPGARQRRHRRRAAVHHRPGAQRRGPRRAERRPRPPAGRERHPARARRRGRPLGRTGRRPHRRRLRAPHHRRPARAQRAGRRPASRASPRSRPRGWPPRGCRDHRGADRRDDRRAPSSTPPPRCRRRSALAPAPTAIGRTAAAPAQHRAHRQASGSSRWAVLLAVVGRRAHLRRGSSASPTGSTRPSSGQIAELRTDWLTDVDDGIDRVGSGWAMTSCGFGLLVALMVFRRWRHLFTFLGELVVLEVIGQILYDAFARPRPFDVTIIGRWAGFSFPAPPVAVLTFVVVGIIYALVVAGRPRTIAKAVGGVMVAAVRRSPRCTSATYHPSDILFGVALAVGSRSTPSGSSRPNEVFPVTYRRGKTAHLDVGGRRGEAIRERVQDQLGLTVLDVKPVGLAGSGGSTPLLITRRRRSRHAAVREALRHEPRPRRPLVQARPDAPLRPPRGRGALPVGAPARAVRGLRAAPAAGRRHPDRRRPTGSSR